MIIKYAILLAVVLVLAAIFTWAFLPARHLPGNRARHLRIRLHLRLHPQCRCLSSANFRELAAAGA
jgi:hypothetical protein